MISEGQKKFLETRYKKFLAKDKPTKKERILVAVYLHRIRKKIKRELDNLLWLCINYPEIFLCECSKNEYGHVHKGRKHNPQYGKQRLKTLLKCVMALTNNDIQLLKEGIENVG